MPSLFGAPVEFYLFGLMLAGVALFHARALTVSIAGLVWMVGPATVVWAALLGFSDAAALILGLTLPPLLCRPEDVARTSAGMFTLSYGGAVAIAVASGAAWDLSGVPALAFAPLAACAVALALVTGGVMWHRKELR